MSSSDLVSKLTSRKFWLMAAAFLGSIGASVAGLSTGNETVATVGTVCAVLSAAIYAACEASVDVARASSERTTTTLTATGKEAAAIISGGSQASDAAQQ